MCVQRLGNVRLGVVIIKVVIEADRYNTDEDGEGGSVWDDGAL